MDYKQQNSMTIKPRIIIHGGAGNLKPSNLPPELQREYRHALLSILARADLFISMPHKGLGSGSGRRPTALETATFAVSLLEDAPLFNSGRGAVFTRDGINELEASVMVSQGYKKRAVGVSGIRSVKNPILLASRVLEAGEQDLEPMSAGSGSKIDVPSAQGHSHLHGPELTETLAKRYGLEIVDPSYYFTQRRWDEHVGALERERREGGAATWSVDEYLPQGTCGAVSLDGEGVVCVATSTGGLTNKLTGRVGDTPTVGAGFWAGEWEDLPQHQHWLPSTLSDSGPAVQLGSSLVRLLTDCLPAPSTYLPMDAGPRVARKKVAFAASGTGNGDSFLRIAAVRTVAARAQWKPESSAAALSAVTGPGGELQRSAGDRWGRTGEGQGGMIGIELVRHYDVMGNILGIKTEILQDFNCGGMFRAWIDDAGKPHAEVWRDDATLPGRWVSR